MCAQHFKPFPLQSHILSNHNLRSSTILRFPNLICKCVPETRAISAVELPPNALRRKLDPHWRGGFSLGVDLGTSRTGLALSKGFSTRPLTVIYLPIKLYFISFFRLCAFLYLLISGHWTSRMFALLLALDFSVFRRKFFLAIFLLNLVLNALLTQWWSIEFRFFWDISVCNLANCRLLLFIYVLYNPLTLFFPDVVLCYT